MGDDTNPYQPPRDSDFQADGPVEPPPHPGSLRYEYRTVVSEVPVQFPEICVATGRTAGLIQHRQEFTVYPRWLNSVLNAVLLMCSLSGTCLGIRIFRNRINPGAVPQTGEMQERFAVSFAGGAFVGFVLCAVICWIIRNYCAAVTVCWFRGSESRSPSGVWRSVVVTLAVAAIAMVEVFTGSGTEIRQAWLIGGAMLIGVLAVFSPLWFLRHGGSKHFTVLKHPRGVEIKNLRRELVKSAAGYTTQELKTDAFTIAGAFAHAGAAVVLGLPGFKYFVMPIAGFDRDGMTQVPAGVAVCLLPTAVFCGWVSRQEFLASQGRMAISESLRTKLMLTPLLALPVVINDLGSAPTADAAPRFALALGLIWVVVVAVRFVRRKRQDNAE